jgi:MFS family permease
MHYAWVMAGLTFCIMLGSAAVRATPSLLMVPLEAEFGWNRSQLSAAIALNIFLFGAVGPFAAAWMDRFTLRRSVLWALGLLGAAVSLSLFMNSSWQLFLLWGLLVGLGSGGTSLVLGSMVASRWFESRRSTVVGALSAANATGQLLFLPLQARMLDSYGWRGAVGLAVALTVLVFLLVLLLFRSRPSDMGLLPYGATAATPTATMPQNPLHVLRDASRHLAFWVLAGSFFVCGASTNGLIGSHLIPACHDYGITEVRAAGLLALMGIFDIIGTTASGWLTDRYSSRMLLLVYYGLRGLALLALPSALLTHTDSSLNLFAFFYGLDWIATVPPTVKLASEAFGPARASVVFGWIGCAHQMGASMAAIGAGAIRSGSGSYEYAFLIAGVLCLLTALVFLLPERRAVAT